MKLDFLDTGARESEMTCSLTQKQIIPQETLSQGGKWRS